MDNLAPLSPSRRLLIEVALAALVGFMVTLFVLSPRVGLLGFMFGVPLGLLTRFLWNDP